MAASCLYHSIFSVFLPAAYSLCKEAKLSDIITGFILDIIAQIIQIF